MGPRIMYGNDPLANFRFCVLRILKQCTGVQLTVRAYSAHSSIVTSWLARAGTIAASKLQPYFSAINKFFRDHIKELVALGPLLTDAR
jgi:hypothetical protein